MKIIIKYRVSVFYLKNKNKFWVVKFVHIRKNR